MTNTPSQNQGQFDPKKGSQNLDPKKNQSRDSESQSGQNRDKKESGNY